MTKVGSIHLICLLFLVSALLGVCELLLGCCDRLLSLLNLMRQPGTGGCLLFKGSRVAIKIVLLLLDAIRLGFCLVLAEACESVIRAGLRLALCLDLALEVFQKRDYFFDRSDISCRGDGSQCQRENAPHCSG